MGSVIERHQTTIEDRDGLAVIVHDDRPATWERADALAGRRLDRRRAYCIIGGAVCRAVHWTTACSGCADDRENVSCDRGSGCRECGYTGLRRSGMWMKLEECEAAEAAEVAA